MKIVSAYYGGALVTDKVEKLINKGRLDIRIGNHLFGDPTPGHFKMFDLTINKDGKDIHFSKKEGDFFYYPESVNKKLGIWYSNCPKGVEKSTLASLMSIQKAANKVADVVTCVWEPIKENPFKEIIAWTKTYSHLNQVIQILQCLYNARTINNYDYVSFLEHDVLYPEGYFDFPEIAPGSVLTNQNYIGVKKNGFQRKNQNDEPLHQMSMRFDCAIAHYEKILQTAIHINSGFLEPLPNEMARSQWSCHRPAVHINHGKHFTSHYAIYGTPNDRSHPYWGNAEQYFS